MSVPIQCDGYIGHKWQFNMTPYGPIRSDVRRDVVCERCGMWAHGIAVFSDGIRAAHIAKKFNLGRYRADATLRAAGVDDGA